MLPRLSAQDQKSTFKGNQPKFSGVLEFNGKHDFSELDSNEIQTTFRARRIRLIAKGKINPKLNYLFQGAFEGNNARLFNAFVNYKHSEGLNFKIGQYKPPFSYEGLLPIFKVNTILRAEGVDFIAKPLGRTGGAFRDIGFSIHGKALKNNKLQYHIRLINGNGLNKIDNNNQKDIVGLLSYNFTEKFNLGAYSYYGNNGDQGTQNLQKEEAFGGYFNYSIKEEGGFKFAGEYNKGLFYSIIM